MPETSSGLAFRQQRFRRECHIATGVPCALKPLSQRDPGFAAADFQAVRSRRCFDRETFLTDEKPLCAVSHRDQRSLKTCDESGGEARQWRNRGQKYRFPNTAEGRFWRTVQRVADLRLGKLEHGAIVAALIRKGSRGSFKHWDKSKAVREMC